MLGVSNEKKEFNPDKSKQAQEIIFSHKSRKPTRPHLVLNSNNFRQTFLKNTQVLY